MHNKNDLRMGLKEALDNLWLRVTGRFSAVNDRVGTLDNRVDDLEDAVGDIDGAMIKSITFNGTAVPKDAQGNVALQETDPTVPSWAKQVKAKTSDFTNDGDGTDNNSPFATKKYVQDNGGKIDVVKVNGTALPIVNKAVNVPVPTSLDDLDDALYVEIIGTATNIHDQLSGLGNGGFTFFKAEHPEMDMLLGKAMPSKYAYGTLVGTIVNCPLPDGTDQYYLNGYYNYYDGQGIKEETGVAVSHFDFTDDTQGGYSLYVYDSAIISNGGSGGGGGSGAVDTITFDGVTHQPDASGNVTLQESDPTVPAWAKAASKPTYTAQEVGALPSGNYTMGVAASSGLNRMFNRVDITKPDNDIPGSSQMGQLLTAMDKNSRIFFIARATASGTGNVELHISFNNHDGSDTIGTYGRAVIAKDGTVTFTFSHPTEIREALDIVEATTAKAGLMSAADKTKLDGLTPGGAVDTVTFNGVTHQPDASGDVAFAESDPTVPSWAKQSSKPSYTAQEVGALPANTPIPSKTSDLTNDAGFITGASIIATSARLALPSAGSSISYNLPGLTADHMLFIWNFSTSAENNPSVNLTWTTYDGYFTITNTSIDTSGQTIQPVFIKPDYVAATAR